MSDVENAVRDAATKLRESIDAARLAGYRVDWPSSADGLASIAVSETAKCVQPQPAAGPEAASVEDPSPAPSEVAAPRKSIFSGL